MKYNLKHINVTYGKDAFFFGALCIFFLVTLGTLPADPDLWGYLAFGKLFWGFAGFPYLDVFSYLPVKHEWVYHEWLTGVLYYPIYLNFGDTGLQLLRYLLLIATLFTTFATARMRGAGTLCTFVIIILLGGYLKMGYSPVRAQIFTYLFFAIYLCLLERFRLGKLRAGILWLIPVQIIWTNLHGGYLAGIGLLLIYTISAYITNASGRKILTLVLVLCLASTLVNPYGFSYWKYTFEAVTMSRDNISEWWPIFKALQEGYGVFAIIWMLCSAAFVAYVFARQRKIKIYEMGVLGVTFALSVSSNRHMVFFLLASCALVPAIVQSVFKVRKKFISYKLPEIKRKSEIDLAMMCLFVLSFLSIFILSNSFKLHIPACVAEKQKEFCYPVGAVELIKQRKLSGNILTLFEWGEYVIWETYPSCKVGLDGRYETIYPDWLCEKYFDFINARPGWREFLKQFPPDMILLPTNRKITSLIREEKTWDIAFENSGSVLFVRPDTFNNSSAMGVTSSLNLGLPLGLGFGKI